VFLGLTITSSWGNGHATTYRGLLRELSRRGHDVLFLERDVPWYRDNRDLPHPPYARTQLYEKVDALRGRFAAEIRDADAVIVGSYVPDGVAVGEWVTSTARGITAFYDIDTPVTLAALAAGKCGYLTPALIRKYDVYLSFTGGPTLRRLEQRHGVQRARPLYCSFDPAAYYPQRRTPTWDLGYMGTFCETRQPGLERLMLAAARRAPSRRFVVAGPGYPDADWGANVDRVPHVPASEHRAFYTAQQFTLNLTRADMVRAGYSPSVRLFEAAACGIPIISDYWIGLETLFEPRSEILISRSPEETLDWLSLPDRERRRVAGRARKRVLAEHTAEHRAIQLERYLAEVRGRSTESGITVPALSAPPVVPAS
jgi:spore maturation protein CgeB